MKLFHAVLVALALSCAGAALATSPLPPMDETTHHLVARLARNLADQSRATYDYALTALNPLYPGTANVVAALNQYHLQARELELLMSGSAVAESVVRRQVAVLSLQSKQVAFAINALGANPWLNALVSRWNQTVTILNQIKAFVPVRRDDTRVAAFAHLY